MKNLMFIVVFVVLAAISGGAQAQESFADIDQELIEQLDLNQEQGLAYIAIMKEQREAFFALQEREWQLQLALYQETFTKLKPVLSEAQLNEFIAVINCVVENDDTEAEPYFVVMGED